MKRLAALFALAVSSCGGPGTPLAAFVLASCATPVVAPPPPVPAPPPPAPPGCSGPCTSPVAFGQLFDSGVSSASQIPYAAAIWSDQRDLNPPGLQSGKYTAGYRVTGTAPAECIMRKADGSVAWEFGDTRYTPIDFTNPVCIALKEAEVLAGIHGQTWLSVDNISVTNGYGSVGVAQPGALKRLYTGAANDPAWLAANLAWVKTLTAFAHGHGLKVMLNSSYGPKDQWEAVAAEADAVMIEGFPQSECVNDSVHLAGKPIGTLFDAYYGLATSSPVPVWAAGYSCAGVPTADESTWSVTADLLTGAKWLSLTGASVSMNPATYGPAFYPKLGKPLGPATGTRPYVRRFEGGTVYVNPSTAPVSSEGHTLPPVTALIVTGVPF